MKTIKGNLFMAMYLMGVSLLLFACNSDLDVQQAYEFDVRTMPVRKEIKQGETVEIRCTLTEKGKFADNKYTIRFFQSEGYGDLRLGKDGEVFLPNDRYPLPDKEFRLYSLHARKKAKPLKWWWKIVLGMRRSWSFNSMAKTTTNRNKTRILHT